MSDVEEAELDLPDSDPDSSESSDSDDPDDVVLELEIDKEVDADAAVDEQDVVALEPAVEKKKVRKAPYSSVIPTSTTTAIERVVRGADRRTSNMLSHTELAAVKAARAKQIAKTGKHYAVGDTTDGTTTELRIVDMELQQKRCPLSVKRYIGSFEGMDVYEIWAVNEMSLPPKDSDPLIEGY